MELVSMNGFPGFKWGEEGPMHYMTCVNHPTAVYLTKNPFSRSLHFIKSPEGFGFGQECPCDFDDMRVVINPTEEWKAI